MKKLILDSIKDKKTLEAVIFFAASAVWNFLHYLFNVKMAAMLPKGDFSAFSSLLALLFILTVPWMALQTVVTQYVSHFFAHGFFDKIKLFFLESMKRVFLVGVIIFIIVYILKDVIAHVLHISPSAPVIIAGTSIIPCVLVYVVRGVLQGMQKFYALGATLFGEGFFRLFFGIILVVTGFKVSGAIAATTIGYVFVLLLGLAVLYFYIPKDNKKNIKINFTEIYKYFWPVLLAYLGINILIFSDIIVVRIFFPPLEADYYAVAELLGKIVFFSQMAIPLIMFPKTAYQHAKSQDSKSHLLISLLFGLAMSLVITAVYYIFPTLILQLIWGDKYLKSAPLLGLFGIAMTFFSLSNILVLYQLSVKQFRFLYILISIIILQVTLLLFIHSTLVQILTILIICGSIFVLLNIILIFMMKPVKKAGENFEEAVVTHENF